MSRIPSLLAFAMAIATPAAALGCLWDYDTLKQERERFPTVLELVTGKFFRHSKEFYEWRIRDRQKKLEADPTNLGHLDDLAVAYEMTGQHAKSIETITAKDRLKPGVYETYSNLGTFHILAGDFELGLPYIDKALAINPDAHFGREKYQKWLVEYAMTRRASDGKLVLPLEPASPSGRESVPPLDWRVGGFARFLQDRQGESPLTRDQIQAAVTGVLGMMRFARHDNPLLLEALADLLKAGEPRIDASRLAARCYLKAAGSVPDAAAKAAYRTHAEKCLKLHQGLELSAIEAEFAVEQAEADAWYDELRAKELRWIAEGKDADAEFDRLYTREPAIGAQSGWREKAVLFSFGAAVLLLVVAAGWSVRRRARAVPLSSE